MSDIVERRAGQLRSAVAGAMADAGVEDVALDGDAVRASGPGLIGRWMDNLALRETGRGGL
jgi:hypothetical protein